MEEIPYGYCQCGCGEKTKIALESNFKREQFKGKPYKYLQGHGTAKRLNRYREDPETGCWIWQLGCTPNGYGKIHDYKNRRHVSSHRYYYELQYGPIPEDQQLDHLCRNKRCCNPAHLEPVTCAENVRRGNVSKLTVADIQRIRTSSDSGIAISKDLGIANTTVSKIRLNKRWKGI